MERISDGRMVTLRRECKEAADAAILSWNVNRTLSWAELSVLVQAYRTPTGLDREGLKKLILSMVTFSEKALDTYPGQISGELADAIIALGVVTSPEGAERKEEKPFGEETSGIISGDVEVRTLKYPSNDIFRPGAWAAFIRRGEMKTPEFLYAYGQGPTEAMAVMVAAKNLVLSLASPEGNSAVADASSAKEQGVSGYVDYQQRQGRLADIIREALTEYAGWYNSDDYDAKGALDRIMTRMEERFNITAKLAPTSPHPVSVGEGWKLVPETLTHEMFEAGVGQDGLHAMWARMLSASPASPPAGTETIKRIIARVIRADHDESPVADTATYMRWIDGKISEAAAEIGALSPVQAEK